MDFPLYTNHFKGIYMDLPTIFWLLYPWNDGAKPVACPSACALECRLWHRSSTPELARTSVFLGGCGGAAPGPNFDEQISRGFSMFSTFTSFSFIGRSSRCKIQPISMIPSFAAPFGSRIFRFFGLLSILLRVQRQLNSQQRLSDTPGTAQLWYDWAHGKHWCGHLRDAPCSNHFQTYQFDGKAHAFTSFNSPKALAKRSFRRLHTSQFWVTGTGVLIWARNVSRKKPLGLRRWTPSDG